MIQEFKPGREWCLFHQQREKPPHSWSTGYTPQRGYAAVVGKIGLRVNTDRCQDTNA